MTFIGKNLLPYQKINRTCTFGTAPAERLKIEIPINIEIPNNETSATHNTDGIIHKLVMVFARPCSHDKSCQNLQPDTRTCPQYKSCIVTVSWLRSYLYRDTAPVPLTKILYPDSFAAPIKLVSRHAYLRLKLVPGWQKPRRTLLAPGQLSGLPGQICGGAVVG
jgi:hypothetical protein